MTAPSPSDPPRIDAVSTRLLTRPLLRPWGADVGEMHLVVVEVEAGHALMTEAPGEVLDALRDFLAA